MTDIRLVFCNAPDAEIADAIANRLIEDRLAACVSIGFPVQSTYRWEGQIETAQEIPIVIKTTVDRLDALFAAIVETHPYEVPEILAVDALDGLPSYCQWVRQTVVD